MNRLASILQRHYENPTHIARHWAVAVLGLFTVLVHLYLNVPLHIEGILFTLNGLGYFILLIAFLSSAPFIAGQRKLLDYAFMGYAAAAIVAWVFLGKPYSALGYSTAYPEITARLAIGLLQHAMIEAFVFGDGEDSDRLEQGVSALLLNALRTL